MLSVPLFYVASWKEQSEPCEKLSIFSCRNVERVCLHRCHSCSCKGKIPLTQLCISNYISYSRDYRGYIQGIFLGILHKFKSSFCCLFNKILLPNTKCIRKTYKEILFSEDVFTQCSLLPFHHYFMYFFYCISICCIQYIFCV